MINNNRAGKNVEKNFCGHHLSGGTEKITENAVKIVGVPSAYQNLSWCYLPFVHVVF